MNIPQLTFTRFVAAICIVILHFGMVVNPFNLPKVFPFICKLDSLVSYFFVLSGFILVVSNSGPEKSAVRLNKKKFWINRFARIYPVYLVALIAVILLVSKSTDLIGYFGWNKIAVNHILMIQAWNPDYVIYYNYPAWSLSVELLFYISFPFLFFVLDKFSWKLLLMISVLGWFLNIIGLVFMVENEVGDKFKYYFPLFHLSTFVAGVSAGLIFCKNFETIKKIKRFIFSLTFLAVLLLVVSIYNDFWFLRYYNNGMFVPVFILLIYSFSLMEGFFLRLFSTRYFVYLGEISYSIYILQIPVAICIFEKKWLYGFNYVTTFWLYLLILILVSAISYQLIEVPMRKKIKHWFS